MVDLFNLADIEKQLPEKPPEHDAIATTQALATLAVAERLEWVVATLSAVENALREK